jgi:hypothetical protein
VPASGPAARLTNCSGHHLSPTVTMLGSRRRRWGSGFGSSSRSSERHGEPYGSTSHDRDEWGGSQDEEASQ